ncbi:MAG: RDD family protein [Dysgonamonadaceae bacterium]|jgi:uncharacterized RDD family membrane protein YckC|nr:RDD family protein [Dysgonamonadaceae bacterium]
MESIDIITGQHVMIKYEPASLIARIAAELLDWIIKGLYIFIVCYILFALVDTGEIEMIDTVKYTLLGILLLPVLGYHFILESMTGGQTWGKMLLKIKVTNADGSISSIGSYFLRWVLMPVDMLFWGGVGILFIVFTALHQRLGDLAAGTVVIKSNAGLTFGLDESFYEFSDDYEPTFKDAGLLTDGQVSFITNLLTEPKRKASVNDSLHEIAIKVKAILHVKSDAGDRLFLETVVKDYNYYASLGI